MTTQEAIEQIRELIKDRQLMMDEHDAVFLADILALRIAILALEKQIPIEIEYYGDGYDDNGEINFDTARCCNCGMRFEVYYDDHASYCPTCGQALDWSDDDA